VSDEAATLVLRGDHITLEALLKATGLADQHGKGSTARALIGEGVVSVNGSVDTRRGRKLRVGDEVALGGNRVRVVAA
jgi:ribosome-associated protein